MPGAVTSAAAFVTADAPGVAALRPRDLKTELVTPRQHAATLKLAHHAAALLVPKLVRVQTANETSNHFSAANKCITAIPTATSATAPSQSEIVRKKDQRLALVGDAPV